MKIRHQATGRCNSDTTITYLTYYIRPDIIRLDFNGRSANSSMIYQPSSKKIWVVYHHEKRFYSMDEDDMSMYDQKVRGAASEYEFKRNQMSEEEKERSPDVFSGSNPLLAENEVYTYRKHMDSLVSQLMCRRYDARLSDGRLKKVYLNNFKSMKIDDASLSILQEFHDFMGVGSQVMAGSLDFTAFRKWDQGGYPVLVETWSASMLCNTLWMTSISREKKKDDFFKVPYSFSRIDNASGRSPESQD